MGKKNHKTQTKSSKLTKKEKKKLNHLKVIQGKKDNGENNQNQNWNDGEKKKKAA